MKVREDNLIERVGNIKPLHRRTMTVNLDNIATIIRPLTDLYSDTVLAPIREYSTNAFDSHVEVGQTRPIEIELPSALKQVFIVRDFGRGLTMDEMLDIYGTYGLSTKTDTNEAVGMLGFGCKSALTYTNQFTVTAVKDGIKTTVLVPKGNDGIGEILVLDTMATNEPNGVEVQIPVKAPIDAFCQKALSFYRFWEPGTVLVNNQVPASFFDGENNDNLFLDPDVLIVKSGELHRDYLVMGNVSYPCDLQTGLKAKVVARVAIGDISFTPSREALLMDEPTKDVCEQVKEFVRDRLEQHIQRQIDAQPGRRSAIVESVRWDDLVYTWRKRPNYRGETIPHNLDMVGQSWNVGWSRNQASTQSYIRTADLVKDNIYVMLHHPARSMLKEIKEAIRADYPNASQVYVVWSMKKESKPWLEAAANIIDYNDLKPVKVKGPRATRPSKYGDGGGKWLCWDQGINFISEDIPTGDDEPLLVYAIKSDSGHAYNTRDQLRRNMGEYLRVIGAPFRFVLLSKGEDERFKKLHPNAVHFSEYFQKRADEIMGQLTEDQFWWGLRGDWRFNLEGQDILDPEIVALLARMTAADAAHGLNVELQKICNTARGITGFDVTLRNRLDGRNIIEARDASKSNLGKEMHAFHKKYPLTNDRQLEATVEYLNATYLYRKGDCK